MNKYLLKTILFLTCTFFLFGSFGVSRVHALPGGSDDSDSVENGIVDFISSAYYDTTNNMAQVVNALIGNATDKLNYKMPVYRTLKGSRAVEYTDKDNNYYGYSYQIEFTYSSDTILKGLIIKDKTGHDKEINSIYYTYVTTNGDSFHYKVVPDSLSVDYNTTGYDIMINNGYTYYSLVDSTNTGVHKDEPFRLTFLYDKEQRSYTVNLNNLWSYYDYVDGFLTEQGFSGPVGHFPLFFNSMTEFFSCTPRLSFEDKRYYNSTTLNLFTDYSLSNDRYEMENYHEYQNTGYYYYNDEFIYNNTYNTTQLPTQITNNYNNIKNIVDNDKPGLQLPDLHLPDLDLPNLPGIDLPDLPGINFPDLPDNPDLPDVPGGSVWIPPKYDKLNTSPIITTRSNVELVEVTFPTSVIQNGGKLLESGLDGLTDCMPELVSVALVCMVFGFLWKFTGG